MDDARRPQLYAQAHLRMHALGGSAAQELQEGGHFPARPAPAAHQQEGGARV